MITTLSRETNFYERTKKLFNILMVFTDRGYLGTKNKGLLLKDKNIQFICLDKNYYLYVKLNNEQEIIFLINDNFVFVIEKDFLRKEKEYQSLNVINEIIKEL